MGNERISVRCHYAEHSRCGGQVKFGNADGTDDCYQCACPCHKPNPEPLAGTRDKGLDAVAVYTRLTRIAMSRNQTVGKDNKYYVTLQQLEAALSQSASNRSGGGPDDFIDEWIGWVPDNERSKFALEVRRLAAENVL